MHELRRDGLTWRELVAFYAAKVRAYRARFGDRTPSRATVRRWVAAAEVLKAAKGGGEECDEQWKNGQGQAD